MLCWLLTRIRFVKNAELSSRVIISVFVLKVLAGIAGGWLLHNNLHSDTWKYHSEALTEYQLLFSNPGEYFTNLFHSGYSHGHQGLFQTQNSYWNDLKDNLIIKLISVFDVFTGGNYYVNVVFYNFTIFFGLVGLFRVFRQVYKANKLLTAAVVFLLPSVLFYTSAIHKDGLVMALIGIVVFNCWQSLQGGFSFKRMVFILLSLVLLFFFRNFVVMALLPALAAWVISERKKLSPVKAFAVVYTVIFVLFLTVQYIIPQVNLQQYIVQKQTDFFALEKGNTTIPTDTLQATPGSFIRSAPQALQHGLLRPLVTDIKLSKMLLPLSLELILYEVIVLLFLFARKKSHSFNHPFILLCISLGLSLCLIIGYTVPVIGAIVRYRAAFLPFILAPFILQIDWSRLLLLIKVKK